MSTGESRDQYNPVAASTPVDDTNLSYTADDVQEALEKQDNSVNSSASPGFSFGRASNVNSGTWLQCEGVPSNKAGRYVYIQNGVVERVFVSNEQITTFDLSVYWHDGNEINLTLLGTVSIVAANGGEFAVSWPVPTGSQLAMQVSNGSGRNMVGGLELSGTN